MADNYELERKINEGFMRIDSKIDRLETRIEGKFEVASVKIESLQNDLRRTNTTLFIDTLLISVIFGAVLAGIVVIKLISNAFDDDD